MKRKITLLGVFLIIWPILSNIQEGVCAKTRKSKEHIHILDTLSWVADSQIKTFSANKYAQSEPEGWITGTFYLGLFDLAELSRKDRYFDWLKQTLDNVSWQMGQRMYHADDIFIGQVYIDMYNRFKQEKMIHAVLERTEWQIQHAVNKPLSECHSNERWTWCDALFMGPGVYSRLYALTQDEKYMQFADREFKASYTYLFSQKDSLFYRDKNYFKRRERNGEKIFWGRGNGWVIAGLVEILKSLPADDLKYKPFYAGLYKKVAVRLAALQGENGEWGTSLLDTQNYPDLETSATGLILNALAYGINQGYIDKATHLPVVEKGWQALKETILADGTVGWVQPVGQNPQKITKGMTELYGTGALLLAGCEILKLKLNDK